MARPDQILVTTQGVKGGKQTTNRKGCARITVQKDFLGGRDVIEVEGLGNGVLRETALINITFQDGLLWCGSFRKLQNDIKTPNEELDYVVSVRDAQAKELTRLQNLNIELITALQSLLNVTEPTARPRKGDLEVNRENGFKAIAKTKGL